MKSDVMPIVDSNPVTRPIALNPRSRVLIVDDHPAIRRALHREFERAGWDVCGSASNGSEAIAKTEELLPELVILDLAMPEMNGLTTSRILKRTFPEIQVILFTGHGDLFKQDEAMAAGISAVCSKSEPIKNLLEKARALASRNAVGAFH
jgi:DNA-binding NarL/FixJ family response regulator